MYNREYTPDKITELKPNEIFVFGSNLGGFHDGGAARVAFEKFGAVWGEGRGLHGHSYALPTIHGQKSNLKAIRAFASSFIRFAKEHPELTFLVTKVGCGFAGHKPEDIAPFFADGLTLDNVILPKEFVIVIEVQKGFRSHPDASWNSDCFRREYCRAMIEVKKGDQQAYNSIRKLRVEEFENTIKVVKQGWYVTEKGIKHEFDIDQPIIAGTKFYEREFSVDAIPAKYEHTLIDLDNLDCLKAAHLMVEMGERPVVLNMASRRNPGGGVLKGVGAQEETLFRRTNLFRSLYQFAPYAEQYTTKKSTQQYPLDRNFGGIYSPDVTVFRDTEQKGYALLVEPFKIAVVSVAGMNRPDLTPDGLIAEWHVEPIKNKIRTIFRIALINGHDAIVLGALGCGAFRNPPRHVARLFHEVIEEKEFKNKFKSLYFAILDDHNSHQAHNPEGNFFPFYEEFKNLLPEEKKMQQALMMWKMGAGNSGKRFNMENPIPPKERVATKDSWKTRPMPEEHVSIPTAIVISAKAMEVVRQGHIPDAMEDHWFMYCDDDTIRYYRSWTGICIFEAKYKIDDEFCVITQLTVNRRYGEYGETDEEKDIALFMGLLTDEYGGDSIEYWNKALK